MSLQTLTFKLSDFGWQSMANLSPRVFFRPTNTGVQGSRIMPDAPVQASIDSAGNGVVQLATTPDTLPSKSGYIVTIDWLIDPAVPDARPCATFTEPIRVLPGFTQLGDLIGAQVDNDMVYVTDGGVDPNINTGFQLDGVSGVLYKRVS